MRTQLAIEHSPSDLVNAAYGRTPDNVAFLCADPNSFRLAISCGVEYDLCVTAILDRSENEGCISSITTDPLENLRQFS